MAMAMAMASGTVSVVRWPTPAPAPAPSQAKAFKVKVKVSPQKKHGVGVALCASSSQGEAEGEGSEKDMDGPGVRAALWVLFFYQTQISPFLPRSCRYVPTCSDYSIQAYRKYGFLKGSVLTACRLCRCNPFGGYGYDPPRWFREPIEEPPSHL